VKLWSKDGIELQTLQGHSDWVLSVAFSPDGETLASASADNTVKLWSKDGTELQTLQGHSSSVLSVAFSPDGEALASASADNTVKLWSKDGTELQTLQGHSSSVWSVAFSPDGETLASASDNNTVKLWSKDGTELQTLQGHSDWVRSVAFSPDGEILATAGDNNTVKLWDFELEDLIARGCDWLGTYFVKQSPALLMELVVCQQQNPSLTVAAAPLLVAQGEDLAREGNVDGAIALLRQAVAWDQTLTIQPQIRARNLAKSQTLVTEAEELAKAGQLSEAVAKLDEAQGLDPALDFEPEMYAKELLVQVYIDEGQNLVRSGNVDEAVQLYRNAEALEIGAGISANDWNDLCWFGSLYNQAEKVMFACERAVVLTPNHGGRIDSRGLARALTGDTQGATADFKTFVEWTTNDDEKAQRQAWIEALEQGKNPFTPEVLEALR
ncbi:MAG: ribosome assembly protein 4, partial [Cyanobacteria bacterium P01_A01_bin.123]